MRYLRSRGYSDFRNEGIMIEGWPVQFLPVSDPLDAEALDKAEEVEIKVNGGRVRARVLKPEHLVALALRVGRAKDVLRAIQFLQEKVVNLRKLKAVLIRHGLLANWKRFCTKTGTRDPFAAK